VSLPNHTNMVRQAHHDRNFGLTMTGISGSP